MSATSSQISTSSIQQIIDKLKLQKYQDSTRKNYYAIWKIFNKFFIHLDRKPKSWEYRIVLFTGYLINNKTQSATVKSYISAIWSVLLDNNIKLNENQYLINSLTKACRLVNDRVCTQLLIQKPLMDVILREINKFYEEKGQIYLKHLYKYLFSTMYFGLFRIGEMAQGPHAVLARDVQIADNKRKFFLFCIHLKHTTRDPNLSLLKSPQIRPLLFGCTSRIKQK